MEHFWDPKAKRTRTRILESLGPVHPVFPRAPEPPALPIPPVHSGLLATRMMSGTLTAAHVVQAVQEMGEEMPPGVLQAVGIRVNLAEKELALLLWLELPSSRPPPSPVCHASSLPLGTLTTTVLTLQGPGQLTVPTFECPSGHPEGLKRSSLRSALASPYRLLGYDLQIAVGLLRFGLDLPEHRVAAVLEDGWGRPLAQSTISRLSTEFLVRWWMLCEERLPPWVAQIDGTVVVGSPVTFRTREARTGAPLGAEQLEAESQLEVVRFLRAFRARFGLPTLLLRDLSATLRGAAAEVYPEVPQGEDPWHLLSTIGLVILVDHEPLRKGLLAGKALARLAQWSRQLP